MLKIVTLFSGIDAQCQALDRIGIEYDLVAWADIEKDVISAHNMLYPQYSERNLGNVSVVDWNNVPDFDVMTYSSPCQSFSSSGLQEGGDEDSGTQSSLLWECKKAIETKHPKYLIFENVKNLMSEKFFPTFQKWVDYLSEQGYTTKYKVVNALDYNIPQNRERVIAVSCLDGLADFSFPEPKPLTKMLSDVLECDLADDVWFDADRTDTYIRSTKLCKYSQFDNAIIEDFYTNRPVRVYNEYSPTLRSERSGLKVVEYHCGAIRGRPCAGDAKYEQRLEINSSEHINTLTTVQKDNVIIEESSDIRIRYLTTREAFRFMDINDVNIDRLLNSGISKTSLLKMAGNSICVGMLAEVFRNLFIGADDSNALF